MYRDGEGTEPNTAMAVQLSAPVAERGYAVGNPLHAGLEAYLTEDYGQALMAYIVAAEAGAEVAQFNVFHIIEQEGALGGDRALPPDLHRLYLRYVRLSARSSPRTMTMLGHLYWYGDRGLPRSHAKAVKLYTTAAGRGEPEANFNLVSHICETWQGGGCGNGMVVCIYYCGRVCDGHLLQTHTSMAAG